MAGGLNQPISHYPKTFPLELWGVLWGRARWRFESSYPPERVTRMIEDAFREYSDAVQSRFSSQDRRGQIPGVQTRRLYVKGVGVAGRIYFGPWPELSVRCEQRERDTTLVELRIAFHREWYKYQAPILTVLAVVAITILMLSSETTIVANRSTLVFGAVAGWLYLAVVLPVVAYSVRREHRRRLIELGNLIQERLGVRAD